MQKGRKTMVNGLSERLREKRTLIGLSQKEVAHILGISPSIVSNYESGERTPSVEILMALANLYHCSTDFLLGFRTTSSIDTSMLNKRQIQLLQNFLYEIKDQL